MNRPRWPQPLVDAARRQAAVDRQAPLNPCVRYVAAGVPHVWWLAPTPGIVVDLAEPGLAHALAIARAAGGTGIRLEFHAPGVPTRAVLSVDIP
jgi:hypothetical protein